MLEKVTVLHAIKPPTVPEEIRGEVIAILESALKEARAGEVSEIFMILKHPSPGNDEWSDHASSTMGTSAWIGKLEITKQSWISLYNEAEILKDR